MITTLDDICEELEFDLCLVRLQHLAARKRRESEDSSENRAAEAACRARLDVILDLLVELRDGADRGARGRHPRRCRPALAPARAEADGALFRAAIALPHDDRRRAVHGLRHQLRVMADAAAASPDWTSLTVTGPTEVAGAAREARFEWTASVAVHGIAFREALLALDPEGGGSSP